MKKVVQKIIFSCSVLFAFPLMLMIVSSAASFLMYYVYASTNTKACAESYSGVSKGTIWDNGEWHHYVDFRVHSSASFRSWEVADAPLPSSLWRDYSTTTIKRVAYRWPSNWRDPFPANDWKICVISS